MKNHLLYWSPRILAILAILFVMLFSLDVFEGNDPLYKQLLGFLIHNIPAMLLITILIVAWKHEITGGILFVMLFIIGSLLLKSFTTNPASLIVIGPFLLIGILFIVSRLVIGAQASKTE